jgi:hypothetical protein
MKKGGKAAARWRSAQLHYERGFKTNMERATVGNAEGAPPKAVFRG